jgi:hypothetical protein
MPTASTRHEELRAVVLGSFEVPESFAAYDPPTEDPDFATATEEAKQFPDHMIHVEDENYPIPHPQRGLHYRRTIDWSAESSWSGLDAGDQAAASKNLRVLKATVPKVIWSKPENKAFTAAILESLWACANNPAMALNPKCFPLRLWSELEQNNQSAVQTQALSAATAVRSTNKWPALKKILLALRSPAATATVSSGSSAVVSSSTRLAPTTVVSSSGSSTLLAPTTAATLLATAPAVSGPITTTTTTKAPPPPTIPPPAPPVSAKIKSLINARLGGGPPIIPNAQLGGRRKFGTIPLPATGAVPV